MAFNRYLVIATGHGNFVLRNFHHQGWHWQKDLLVSHGDGRSYFRTNTT